MTGPKIEVYSKAIGLNAINPELESQLWVESYLMDLGRGRGGNVGLILGGSVSFSHQVRLTYLSIHRILRASVEIDVYSRVY